MNRRGSSSQSTAGRILILISTGETKQKPRSAADLYVGQTDYSNCSCEWHHQWSFPLCCPWFKKPRRVETAASHRLFGSNEKQLVGFFEFPHH